MKISEAVLIRLFVVLAAVCAMGQAAAAALRTSPGGRGYWVEQVADGLQFPSAAVWLPDGDMLIAERSGTLRRLRNGALDPHPIIGAPESFQNYYNGLKDIALDPDFRTTRTVYLLISEGTYDQHHAAVYRARLTATTLTDLERIFRAKEDIGGVGGVAARMLLLPDKTLLVAIPEDDSHRRLAQQLSSHIGKVVRINSDGSVPSDNPLRTTPNALAEIWSYGHRVQTGLYRDPSDGAIWEIETGPRGGDELNILKPGANFGWAAASWGFDYGGGLAAPRQFAPNIEDPLLVWMPPETHSIISPTPAGIVRYRGATYPSWDGDFFVGQLGGKVLERLRVDGRKVVLREKMLMDLEERIRDVKVGPDNRIYLLTDNQNGRVLRLQPGSPRGAQNNRVARKLETPWVANEASEFVRRFGEPDIVRGRQAFLERCAGCHSVGTAVRGANLGPDLAGVYGRQAGSKAGFNYSPAMASLQQAWSDISLDLLLADPARYVPGTQMVAPPLSDARMRWDIIGFLKAQSQRDESSATVAGAPTADNKSLSAVTFAIEEAKFKPPNSSFSDDGLLISGASVWSDPATGRRSYLIKWTKGTDLRHKHTFSYQVVILKGVMTHWTESLPGSEVKQLRPGSLWYAPGGEVHIDKCLTDECLTLSTTFEAGDTIVVPDTPKSAAVSSKE